MIERTLQKALQKKLKDNKAIIILGPRQVGKTTLLNILFSSSNTLWLNGDDSDTRSLLEKPNATKLKSIIGKHKYLIID